MCHFSFNNRGKKCFSFFLPSHFEGENHIIDCAPRKLWNLAQGRAQRLQQGKATRWLRPPSCPSPSSPEGWGHGNGPHQLPPLQLFQRPVKYSCVFPRQNYLPDIKYFLCLRSFNRFDLLHHVTTPSTLQGFGFVYILTTLVLGDFQSCRHYSSRCLCCSPAGFLRQLTVRTAGGL